MNKKVELSRGLSLEVKDSKRKDRYDVVLNIGGGLTQVPMSTGCVGEKSADSRLEYHTKEIKRIIFLMDGIDMAYNNLFAYSKTWGMEEPKDGYEDEWTHEKEEAEMLKSWMKEMVDKLDKNVREELMTEFYMYMAFASTHHAPNKCLV